MNIDNEFNNVVIKVFKLINIFDIIILLLMLIQFSGKTDAW